MLQLDVQQVISQALSFLLLLWVLKRFAWRPLLGILDSRRRQIEEAFQDTARNREEVARLRADYESRIGQIDAEARQKLQQTILEGKRIALEIQEEARQQAQAVLTKSKESIELEVAKAKVTLRDQMADLTIEAVERVLQRKLDVKQDRALVDAVLDELDAQAARD